MSDNSLKKGRYTRHSNKIGLYSTSQDRIGFLSNNNDVVLSFPFKDAVLEAGMSKEDSGREERFLHQEIDAKDIDTLFEPKALTNFQYYSHPSTAQHTLDESENKINFFDENGELQQNLLIKGNNLLALHSLSSKLAGKIKLIYIDPPYNTGSDGFKYNDNFNHSSWLTFMKNRLEVARGLLRDDGVIFVQCDDNEQAYLKVLMDEIFGRESFVTTIHVQMSTTQGMKVKAAQDGNIVKNAEYMIVFSKDGHKNIAKHPLYDIRPEYDEHYSLFLQDDGQIVSLKDIYDYRFPKDLANKKALSLAEAYKKSDEFSEFVHKNLTHIVREDKVTGFDDTQHLENRKWIEVERNNKKYLLTLNSKNSVQQLMRLSASWGETDGYKGKSGLRKIRGDWWEGFYLDMGNVAKEDNVEFKNGKKPQRLIEQVIRMTTDENDIVLDYHLGSGTTAAVAHRLNRRWVGIEQMDYINTITLERLKNVTNEIGNSFVYFELKKYNQDFLNQIMAANSKGELDEVYADMAKNAFLKFWFDKNEFEKDENFRSLDLDQRKELLISILDENQLYLNHADMRDSRYHVSEEEMNLTDLFYGAKND